MLEDSLGQGAQCPAMAVPPAAMAATGPAVSERWQAWPATVIIAEADGTSGAAPNVSAASSTTILANVLCLISWCLSRGCP